jgi:DNA-binding LytR/AlgR family response regulator
MVELRTVDDIVIISENDIYMAEAVNYKSIIYAETKKIEVIHSIKELEAMLSNHFFRTSRSFLVNVRKVISVKPSTRKTYELVFSHKTYRGYLSKNLYEDFRQQAKISSF